MKKLLVAFVLLFVGMQGAFASMDCEGTIYLKLPDGWRSAFSVGVGEFNQFTASTTHPGWYELSADSVGGSNSAPGFNIVTARDDYGQKGAMTPSGITAAGEQVHLMEATGFKCGDFGATGELWIEPDPADPTKVRYSGIPADVKYFRIMVPDNAKWNGSIPMIVEDGGEAIAMNADPDRCGWYFRRYIDEVPPSEVVIYRDDDEKKEEGLGMEGNWGTGGRPTPIDLAAMFDSLQSNEIFFVAEDKYADKSNPEAIGWTSADPSEVRGNCGFDLAAIIYDTDASLHGAFTCAPDRFNGQTENQARANACYYSSAKFNVVNSNTAEVPCIGVTTGMVSDILDKDKKPKLTETGKKCFGSQADEAFEAMFNSTSGVNEAYCFNLPLTQTKEGKYEFNSDNYEGPTTSPYPAKGGFYPAEKTPVEFLEGSEYLPAAENKRKAEGPVFFCADYNNQRNPGEGLRAIDPTEGVPAIDLFCNGPGWTGGVNCEGKFAGGNEFNAPGFRAPAGVSFEGDGWGWSCPDMGPIGWTYYKEGTETPVGNLTIKNQVPTGGVPRWTSGANDYGALSTGGRNQHFCFESHATFRYKKGLRLSVRGDDDIWVYIDNKLAVDIGGTHYPAPGYVDLDKFVGKQGVFLVGTEYDIDIYFCDRRTTMSNIRINTNMYFRQRQGSSISITKTSSGMDSLSICHVNGCSSLAMGNMQCGDNISADIHYSILNNSKQPVDGCDDCVDLPTGGVVFGGIDLTNAKVPRISAKDISDLQPGTYYLAISIDNDTSYYKFIVSDPVYPLTVATGDISLDSNDSSAFYPAKTKWRYIDKELAGVRVPVYVSVVDSLSKVDLKQAAGQGYSLTVSEGALLYSDSSSKKPLKLPYVGTVDSTGIDTLWVTFPLDSISGEKQDVEVSLGDSKAEISFYAPVLSFAEADSIDALGNIVSWKKISADPDTTENGSDYFHWVGSDVKLNLVVTNPVTGKLCTECGFELKILDASDSIVATVDSLHNGVAHVLVRSGDEYADTTAEIRVGSATNKDLSAVYGNMHFIAVPLPKPQVVELFDVKGGEYVDGKADSLVIIYDKVLNKNFLPTFICLNFDEKHLKKVNPYKLGVSSDKADTAKYCSSQIESSEILEAYKNSPDKGKTLVFVEKDGYSADVKTTVNGNDKLTSFFEYESMGAMVKDYFEITLTDHIAPVLLSASVQANGSCNTMTLRTSELLSAKKYKSGAFEYNLYSVDNGPKIKKLKQDSTATEPDSSDIKLVFCGDTKPWKGDQVRFAEDSAASLPFAWVKIHGDSMPKKIKNEEVPIIHEKETEEEPEDDGLPNFRIKMVGPFEFAIELLDDVPAKARSFAVMDIQGRVMHRGKIVSKETVVQGLGLGNYIVKVGMRYRSVNISR